MEFKLVDGRKYMILGRFFARLCKTLTAITNLWLRKGYRQNRVMTCCSEEQVMFVSLDIDDDFRWLGRLGINRFTNFDASRSFWHFIAEAFVFEEKKCNDATCQLKFTLDRCILKRLNSMHTLPADPVSQGLELPDYTRQIWRTRYTTDFHGNIFTWYGRAASSVCSVHAWIHLLSIR